MTMQQDANSGSIGKGEKWTDAGNILGGDFIAIDKLLVLRNEEEEDGLTPDVQVSGPSHHLRISFHGRVESKKSKKFTKRELSREKNKEK